MMNHKNQELKNIFTTFFFTPVIIRRSEAGGFSPMRRSQAKITTTVPEILMVRTSHLKPEMSNRKLRKNLLPLYLCKGIEPYV